MNSKCLWVKGTDGMGNRLLSLEYACRYAAEHQYGIHVDWRDEIAMMDQEAFLEIFSIHGVPILGSPDPAGFVSPYPSDLRIFTEPDIGHLVTPTPLVRRFPQRYAFWRKSGKYHEAYRYRGSMKTAMRNGQYLSGLAGKHDLLCFRCSLPWREPEHFRHVSLKTGVVDGVLRDHPSLREANDVSLHIRNTDKSSPEIRRAIRAVRHLLQDDPSVRTMHLATDNLMAADEVVNSLGDSLEIQMLEITRDSDPIHLRVQTAADKARMLRMAMVDIHLLSSARYLLFQSNSSFSRVAVALQSPQAKCSDWTSFAG